jgi:cytidylate kinase
MSVITISKGSFSKGKEVAEKVAQKLDYACLSLEILLEASEEFNVPEKKLIRAIHDAPSIFSRFSNLKQKYISFIQATLLKHLRKDNIVFHGLAGHFLVKNISHVLKVRILEDMNDRLKLEMEQEGLTEKEALRKLKKDDHERLKWSHYLYGIDTSDPSLYDLVIHINKLSVDDAVEIICHTVALEHLQTNTESERLLDDMVLATEVKFALMPIGYKNKVSAENGIITVEVDMPVIKEPLLIYEMIKQEESQLVYEIEKRAKKIHGVKQVKTVMHSKPVYIE